MQHMMAWQRALGVREVLARRIFRKKVGLPHHGSMQIGMTFFVFWHVEESGLTGFAFTEIMSGLQISVPLSRLSSRSLFLSSHLTDLAYRRPMPPPMHGRLLQLIRSPMIF